MTVSNYSGVRRRDFSCEETCDEENACLTDEPVYVWDLLYVIQRRFPYRDFIALDGRPDE